VDPPTDVSIRVIDTPIALIDLSIEVIKASITRIALCGSADRRVDLRDRRV
jgi:hypothetical protein